MKRSKTISVRHGFENETLAAKVNDHLCLCPEERFFQAINMMQFLAHLNSAKVSADDFQPDRTVQIIKPA